jgi:hypothetical protein
MDRVIRLKVDATGTMVNTIRDQQTGRGLSLVCPFPALEVNIPVHFSNAEMGEAAGVIHRIGVEDDPETGLPKLRLSIRSDDTRISVVSDVPAQLSAATAAATANTDPVMQRRHTRSFEGALLDLSDNSTMDCTDGDFVCEQRDDYSMDAHTDSPIVAHSDPNWTGSGSFPAPSTIIDPLKTRRRQRAIGVAAWMMVLGIAVGGLVVLGKAGIVNVDGLRGVWSAGETPVSSDAKTDTGNDMLARLSRPEGAIRIQEAETEAAGSANPTALQPASLSMDESATVADDASDDADREPVDAESATADPDDAEEAHEDISVTLPTRWPVEYASAYRLRDPNGVVVDVPGGLVRREGWLELGDKYPMIRSIKAVQREGGARFVVYVNGDLPRFMTNPHSGGVELRLIRENTDFPGRTERVAMLSH